MSTVILCCNTLENELNRVLGETGRDYPVVWLEAGLHNQPDRLRNHIKETLDACCGSRGTLARVLLALGHCGGAVSRFGPFDFEMVFPRADDCLSILMGSVASRRQASEGIPTYFLTDGWLRHTENLITSFSHDQELFGPERAERVYKIMLKHYQRFGFIDTGTYKLESAMKATLPLADLIGIRNERLVGSLDWLRRLITGPWNEDDFIVIPPGGRLEDEDWAWLAGGSFQDF